MDQTPSVTSDLLPEIFLLSCHQREVSASRKVFSRAIKLSFLSCGEERHMSRMGTSWTGWKVGQRGI